MPHFPPNFARLLGRVVVFSVSSNAAVLFTLLFGQICWPQGLPAHSQNVFWLASGVNVAGVLVLGFRFWPVILLDAFPAHWLAGEPLDLTMLGSGTNALEALLAAWMIRRFGAWEGGIDVLRATSLLLVASLVAPLVNTVIIPAYFCVSGAMPWENYGRALGNWNLANGAAMLMIAPLLLSWLKKGEMSRGRWREMVVFMIVGAAICGAAFFALFSGVGMNMAFVVFPVVIYASVRFGLREVSAVFVLVLLAIYGSLAWHARVVPGAELASTIWFAQAFCWVLAATGLLVVALMTERRQMEIRAREEQARTLEASLREQQARFASLRYQINPHFLFNALNSIRATLPLSQSVTRDMVTALSDYFRTTLTDPEADTAPVRDEVASVEQYLAIEKQRFGEELRVAMEVDPGVAEKLIPIFLIQPLVENAIHHGFSTSPDQLELKVVVRGAGRNLMIEITNSGSWKEPGSEGRSGIGLENIRRRLKLLYGDSAHLKIDATPGWVRVIISIPLEEKP